MRIKAAGYIALVAPLGWGDEALMYPPFIFCKETVLDWNNTEGTVTLSEGNILRVEYTPIIMSKGSGFTFD